MSPYLQLYVGVAGESISFPNRAAAEIDGYFGIRPTFGPLALYWYPGGTEILSPSANSLEHGHV